MGTSLGTRNNIMKWMFFQIILIVNYLSNWNGSFAKRNQLGNHKTNKEYIQLWTQKKHIHKKGIQNKHIYKWEPLWELKNI
jgi:hypothetical protein